ncbi:hypothetical protein RHSIM_Rhsim01G0149800 [Rhododendron simsii]|uniref:Glycosyl hydrolase family 32 C-terminal domain-containing protein n=1 Tax=Rhododendron simsii TaxID=118357 RepID=A0A834HDX7_RHOSS|nr:hypothetical protein RHSIM_Rhsim01G0149800 [Rhododendron simsii]
MYQSKTSRNKALLMRRLVNLKLKSGNSVAVHSSEFQNLVNQLASVGMKFDDELQALLLLSSLPDDWETLVVSLSNSAPDGKLTTALVKDALFNEEAWRKEMGTDNDDGTRAMVTDGNRGRSPGGATVKHGTSGIGCSVGQGVHQLPICTWRERGSTRRCHGSSESVWDSGLKMREQLMQDVHREAQRKGTGILRMGAPKTKKRVSFALDLVIPRTILLDKKTGNNLILWPVEEIENLRSQSHEFDKVEAIQKYWLIFALLTMPQLDIIAEFEIDKEVSERTKEANEIYNCTESGGGITRGAPGPFGLLILFNNSIVEQTSVYFYVAKRTNGDLHTFFCTDLSRSSEATDVLKPINGSTVPVLEGEKLTMRILVDHSIVEGFAQGEELASLQECIRQKLFTKTLTFFCLTTLPRPKSQPPSRYGKWCKNPYYFN